MYKNRTNVFPIILLIMLIINTAVFAFAFNGFNYVNKVLPIVVNLLLVFIVLLSIYFIYKLALDITNKRILIIVISIILNILFLIFNIGSNILDNMVSDITNKDEIYKSTIIVRSDSNITLDTLNDKNIGISGNTDDLENYKLAYEFLEKNNKLNNTFYRYEDYALALSDLLNGKIDALVISANYLELYGEYFEDLDTRVKPIINELSYSVKIESNAAVNKDAPFTVLIIGADSKYARYNADVQILMSINPNTKKVVMVDVVRDTYALNLGNNMMDKITHAGSYGTQNVVNTVSNLFDIKIDYYIKLNFQGLIDIVNMMGGLEMDVPYRYTVKPGGRRYYVEPGHHKLNGLEALTYARTRKEAGSSLLTRGEAQMNVIEAITKQIDSKFLMNNFFDIFNTLSTNITTNISKQDLYYYIQKYAVIKNELEFSHNQLKGTDAHYYHPGMKMNLYTYKYDENSLTELKELLKNNLK